MLDVDTLCILRGGQNGAAGLRIPSSRRVKCLLKRLLLRERQQEEERLFSFALSTRQGTVHVYTRVGWWPLRRPRRRAAAATAHRRTQLDAKFKAITDLLLHSEASTPWHLSSRRLFFLFVWKKHFTTWSAEVASFMSRRVLCVSRRRNLWTFSLHLLIGTSYPKLKCRKKS